MEPIDDIARRVLLTLRAQMDQDLPRRVRNGGEKGRRGAVVIPFPACQLRRSGGQT